MGCRYDRRSLYPRPEHVRIHHRQGGVRKTRSTPNEAGCSAQDATMRKLALAALALAIASCQAPLRSAHAQQCPIAQHCFTCTYQQTIARNRAGDPRAVRLTRETSRRGGTAQAAHTLQTRLPIHTARHSPRLRLSSPWMLIGAPRVVCTSARAAPGARCEQLTGGAGDDLRPRATRGFFSAQAAHTLPARHQGQIRRVRRICCSHSQLLA